MKGKNSLYRVGSLYRGSLYRALTVIRPIFHLILPTTHIIRPIWLAGLIKRVLIWPTISSKLNSSRNIWQILKKQNISDRWNYYLSGCTTNTIPNYRKGC